MRSPTSNQSSEIIADNNNNSNYEEVTNCKKYLEKYSLRQRQKRVSTLKGISSLRDVLTDQDKSIKEKLKAKAAPLSKYRRKTANARERTRMREINCAFETLRKCVPLSLANNDDEQTIANEKLTKITTLRLAMKYIKTLTEALDNPNPNHDIDYLINSQKDDSFCDLNNISVNDNNDEVKIPKSSGEITRCRNLSKVQGRGKQKQKVAARLDHIAQYTSLMNENQTELGLLLESDGESLHLSESCLSPLSQSAKSFCNVSLPDDQLGLNHLFESDDSIEFSEPPCLSPLATLDAFNPFPDLLQSEFSEQVCFDMYLT